MSTSGQSSVIFSRYANALIELAEEKKVLKDVEKDLGELSAMIDGSEDLKFLIESPLNDPKTQMDAIVAIASKAKFAEITQSFLGVVAQNGRLELLPGIIKAVNTAMDKRRGAITVDVQVAQDMSAKQQKALEDALSKAIGKDVAINARVEPSILGGIIVTVGSHMIDDSVRRKLERLKVSMGSSANENISLKEVS